MLLINVDLGMIHRDMYNNHGRDRSPVRNLYSDRARLDASIRKNMQSIFCLKDGLARLVVDIGVVLDRYHESPSSSVTWRWFLSIAPLAFPSLTWKTSSIGL